MLSTLMVSTLLIFSHSICIGKCFGRPFLYFFLFSLSLSCVICCNFFPFLSPTKRHLPWQDAIYFPASGTRIHLTCQCDPWFSKNCEKLHNLSASPLIRLIVSRESPQAWVEETQIHAMLLCDHRQINN